MTTKTKKRSHGIITELPDYGGGSGGSGSSSPMGLPTSQTSITRMTGRAPAPAAPGSLPTGQTSIVRGNGGIGAANLGTFGSRTVASSGDSIGSGRVRGEAATPAAPAPTYVQGQNAVTARTSRVTGTAGARSGTAQGRFNAAVKTGAPAMMATGRGTSTTMGPKLPGKTVPGAQVAAARPVHPQPRMVGAQDSEGFAGHGFSNHAQGRSNCKF